MMSEASVPDLTTGQKDRDAVKAQAVSEENGAEKSTADSATRLGDKTKASHAGAKRPKTLTDFFAARPSKRARKPTSPAQDQEDPCETGELSKATPMDALSSFSGRKALEEKPPGTGSSLGSDDGSNSEAKKKPKGGSGFVINESTPIDVSKLDPRQYERCKLEYDTMEPSWVRALQGEFKKPYFIQLKEFLASEVAQGRTIYPPERDIYSWSRYSPLKKIKVVILGQDPYHNQNQAHGLAFSVRQGVRTPPSLCNMYQELKSEYPDTFKIPKDGYLGGWAEQGVLLLNAALTVRAHAPNSHAGKGWEQLTDAVIKMVNDRKSNVVFMLWGSYAQKKGKGIDRKKHLVLTSTHPSPLSAHRGFLGCGHFKKANEYLVEHKKKPIDWMALDVSDGPSQS